MFRDDGCSGIAPNGWMCVRLKGHREDGIAHCFNQYEDVIWCGVCILWACSTHGIRGIEPTKPTIRDQRDALVLAAEAALKRIQQGLDHRVAYVGDETLANQLRAAIQQAKGGAK